MSLIAGCKFHFSNAYLHHFHILVLYPQSASLPQRPLLTSDLIVLTGNRLLLALFVEQIAYLLLRLWVQWFIHHLPHIKKAPYLFQPEVLFACLFVSGFTYMSTSSPSISFYLTLVFLGSK